MHQRSCFPARAALSRATGFQPSARRSPDKARQAPPPGRRCRTCCISAAASRLALCLAGLQVSSRLHADSPDKARQAPPPGRRCRTCCISAAASRLALRLAGLQVSSRLHAGSPDKARQAPPPGKVPNLMHQRSCFPARAALSRATGFLPSARRSPDKARQAPPPGMLSG
ncbi:hypothetical protein FMJ29_03415 [Klebsiella michiganensis]|uniref:hypothetical protein n=1 Tax=Klebsiella michiganensis TaxID=1134687 RepID=UPI001CCAC8D7|nr:hypothetical protein [Klebsiella michiganensis]MBZ7458017.1 hypothetical protein [Klebsiella michiganensis]